MKKRNPNKTRVWLITLLLLPTLQLLSSMPARAATITTEQLDYAPFTDVLVSGSGFAAEEGVQLTLEIQNPDGSWTNAPSNPPDWPNPWTVTADASGNISDEWNVWTEDFLGVTFRLTAVGQSSGE